MWLRTLAVAAVALVGSAAAGAKGPLEAVATGKGPCGITAEDGALWVGVYYAGAVVRVDPRSGRATRTRVGRWACRVAVDRQAIWVTRDRAGELVRISRSSGRIERRAVGAGAFDVLLAHGSVWTTSYDTAMIARSSARTLRLERGYKDGPNPAGLAACAGNVWVGHGATATWVTSIDPRTQRVRRVDVRATAPGWPVCIRGVIWLTTPDSVLRLDPRSGRVLSRLRLGETLAHAAEGPDGLVWVTDKQHSRVHRVTPDGAELVDSFSAGPGAFALARVGAAMWVTSFAGSDVRRYAP